MSVTESRPMKASEIEPGTYVCVRNCQHSPHITIRSDGVWVRSPDPDPLNPGSHIYSSAHRDCYEAWADNQGATRVDQMPSGLYHVTSGSIIRERGNRTDALALAEYLENRKARTPVNPELFRRTAPAWNCVDYPDGPHYLPGTGPCAWCGMTRTEIAEDDKRLAGQEN